MTNPKSHIKPMLISDHLRYLVMRMVSASKPLCSQLNMHKANVRLIQRSITIGQKYYRWYIRFISTHADYDKIDTATI